MELTISTGNSSFDIKKEEPGQPKFDNWIKNIRPKVAPQITMLWGTTHVYEQTSTSTRLLVEKKKFFLIFFVWRCNNIQRQYYCIALCIIARWSHVFSLSQYNNRFYYITSVLCFLSTPLTGLGWLGCTGKRWHTSSCYYFISQSDWQD